jgi:hypothetical protein
MPGARKGAANSNPKMPDVWSVNENIVAGTQRKHD